MMTKEVLSRPAVAINLLIYPSKFRLNDEVIYV